MLTADPAVEHAYVPVSRAAPDVNDWAVRTRPAVLAFIAWLQRFGERSYDHQSYFAGRIGGRAKALYYRNRALGTLAVAPMILSEAFVPSARTLFFRPGRFPIADAHY